MGSYCELYIADYPVFSSKSYAEPHVMTIFRESDKHVYQRKVSDRNPINWSTTSADNGELETAVEYRTLVKHARQRLDILGFTFERVKREFERVRAAELLKLKEWVEDSDYALWENDIAVFEASGLHDYLREFEAIIASGVHPVRYLGTFPDVSPLVKYMLRRDQDLEWGFPCEDVRSFFRALMEVAPDDSYVIQDLTDVVYAGYYDEDDDVWALATMALTGDYPTSSKIIVLTEGAVDAEILRRSLKLLYPHLYGYYSFMDFGVKSPGGATALVDTVKAFSGAGIENRVIALFDNDTAALSAVENLRHVQIPTNIVVQHCPDIELARRYPTLGPNGLIAQDINGLACSLELYFGRDVLEVDGALTPIQWRGYDERVGRYQGEILHKRAINKRFLEKLLRHERGEHAAEGTDWSGIDSILRSMFGAFGS